eukprot:TRINITY_DN2314_c1_g1_i2.p1 TRINITY_DN2314_c1_g1~~TRINITY_DN2314_c1_g1_i2.p1  ORF type:complete len:118 (+),score=30.52 TRINITY_DN2314_c1_g1_i2:61-414(+)
MPDELAIRLSREQEIRAPYFADDGTPDAEDLRRHVGSGDVMHCFVNFPPRAGKKGETSLNSTIKKENGKFDDEQGTFSFVGEPFRLNGTLVKIHATIRLATMTGTGRCEILAETDEP